MRIPVGFWAWDNAGTPYIQGAVEYLDQAIEWARNHKMVVWVDLHGHPGSQNGFDNSGQKGDVNWQADGGVEGPNMQRSISVLKQVASKYGSEEYADVVAAIELVNEPVSWGNNDPDVTKQWVINAYNAVRESSTNADLQIVTHDAFKNTSFWLDASDQLNTQDSFKGFGIDTHAYQLFNDEDNTLNQASHVDAACAWQSNTFSIATSAGLPIYAGEWTATSNVCVNPDGSTIAGTSTQDDCKEEGCQCVVDTPPSEWSDSTKKAVKGFVVAQISAFERWSSGFFVWNFKGPGTWSFVDGVEQGWFPKLFHNFPTVC